MRRAVLLAPFAVLLLAGSSGAGSYVPPPGDCCPQWSPNGTQIVFTTNRTTGIERTPTVGAVSAAGGPEQYFPGIPVGARSPDWTYVAYHPQGGGSLAVARVDGSDEHVLGQTTGDFAWSPDSKRIAFITADGSLFVIQADGSGLATLASKPRGADPATRPAWSPNGQRVAYERGTAIHVVGAAGTGDTNITPASTRTNVGPVWSRDSTRVAFWSNTGTRALLAVARLGGATRTYSIRGAVTDGAIVFAPNGKAIFGAGAAGLVRIDLATGRRRTLAGISNAVFSPNGGRIAYAAGGECRDRVGTYVANQDGSGRRRLTNSCRIVGTAGRDVLHGDFSRVVLGLGGDDTLYADDTYYFFDGNALYGGPGHDRLIGGYGQDTLDGGPGDDTLSGGPSGDALIGGPGHDTLNGQGGRDVIYAVDGQRDRITCGPNAFGKNGRDIVYADRVDVVASDCEVVHRS